MNKKQLSKEIDAAIKSNGRFYKVVTRKGYYTTVRLAYEIEQNGNPNIDRLVHSVSCLPNDYGSVDWNFSINKNFDTREQFITSLLRHLKKEPIAV